MQVNASGCMKERPAVHEKLWQGAPFHVNRATNTTGGDTAVKTPGTELRSSPHACG